MTRDEVTLRYILGAIGKIEAFTHGMTAESFQADGKTQSAVIMQLMVIGEMVKRLSEGIRARTAIPWKDVAGLRDFIAHAYFNVDLNIIWNTLADDLPKLRSGIISLLEDASSQAS